MCMMKLFIVVYTISDINIYFGLYVLMQIFPLLTELYTPSKLHYVFYTVPFIYFYDRWLGTENAKN